MIDLLSPSGLWLLGLLAPLVVLYILKIRRQRRKVASTWLWASAERDRMARSPFKRLVAQLPLVLQALALAALALALARPASRGRELAGDHVAFVLDTSASMSAKGTDELGPEGPTRLDLAKTSATELLATLAPGSDAMVLEAGRDARVVAPLDRDARRLREAIGRVQAEDVEGDLGAAVALAVDRLRQLGGSRRIVVFTDGNLARPGSLAQVALPVEVVTVGKPVENTGIVRIDVRTGTDPATSREQVQAFGVVANFGKQARDLYVTLRQDNASDVLASRRVLVKPGERLPVVLTFFPAPGDRGKGLLLEVAPRDAMPADDLAFGRVPPGEKLPVFLASTHPRRPSPWLERALASDPHVELHSGTVEALLATTSVGSDAFVVIEGACPAAPPGGDLLIVAPPPGRCFGTLVGADLDHPTITSWDTADARMRFLTLDGVHISKANSLLPEGRSQELIRTERGTIATDVSTSARTGTLLGFDVGESDWPLKASYVLFIRNLLEQARTHRAHGVSGPARAGEPMRVALPATAERVEATGPAGEKLEVSVRGGLAVVPQASRAGFYRLSWVGPQAGTVVVPANLTSEAESDLADRPLTVGGASAEAGGGAARPDAQGDWTWLLALAALALVVADVGYLTRRRRPSAAGAALATSPAPKMPERRPT